MRNIDTHTKLIHPARGANFVAFALLSLFLGGQVF